MVLEATMIIVDNSESSRNGDYVPSRFEAQADAVNLIFSAKTNSNPESSVGLMSMGGQGPEVLTTLTTDTGKILDGIHRTKIKGASHIATGISIAALALKHRQNRSQRQRIIVFTCSPIAEDEKTLIKLAKRLKKINVSVDIIAFGDLGDDTVRKLETFNENIRGSGSGGGASGEGSHLAIVPPGPNLLSDVIITTPILAGDGVGAGGMGAGAGGAGGGAGAGADGGDGGAGAGGNGFEFGVDPSMDPELALALRMSYEEEKSRQEREGKEKEKENAAKDGRMEGIPEDDEKKPLLDKDGEPAAAASYSAGDADGTASAATASSEDKKEGSEVKKEVDDKGKTDDADKMDTA